MAFRAGKWGPFTSEWVEVLVKEETGELTAVCDWLQRWLPLLPKTFILLTPTLSHRQDFFFFFFSLLLVLWKWQQDFLWKYCLHESNQSIFLFPRGQSCCFFFNFGLNGWKNMLRNFYGKGASFSFQNAKGGWTTNSNHGCFCLFVLFVNSVLLTHRGLLIDIFSCGLLVLYWFKQTNQRNLLGNIRFTLQHIRISDAEWCHGCYTDIAHIALGSAPLFSHFVISNDIENNI